MSNGSAEDATVKNILEVLTLRDLLAAMALQGFLASLDVRVLREAGCMLEEQHRLLATMSYGQADAMVAQREAQP